MQVEEKKETEQSLSSVRLRDHGVRQDQDAGTPAGPSFQAVELQKLNVAATPVEKLRSESIFSSESMLHLSQKSFNMPEAEISKMSPEITVSSSISGRRFADKYTEGGIVSEDSKTEKLEDIVSVSGFGLHHIVEAEFHGKIHPMNKMKTVTDVEFSAEKPPTSSNAEISKHDEESTQVLDLLSFQEEHYLVVVEDNHLQLTLDNQIILIEDFSSPVPPDSSHLPDLRFLDISDTKISILPSSLFKLSKLKVLLLRNCVCLENLPHEIGKLNHMEALDLSGTELYDLPDEIGQLGHLRSMQLSFYGPDDESEYEYLPSRLVSPSFLSELTEIRVLSISVHPEDHRWTEIAACIIKDVSKLEMLSYLHFYFPEVKTFEKFIQMSPSWDKQRVRKFDFIVGQNVKRIASRVPDEVESLFNQQERCLRYVNGDNASPFMKTVLIHVTAFYLDHHTELQSLSEFDISNFRALKFCVVRECPKIQTILDEKNAASAFPCLEHLGIYFLWELKHIWKPSSSTWRLNRIFRIPSPSGNFKALRCLIINTCPMLQFILWESMLQCLSNLEELVVEDCERVEKIIKEEKKKVKYEGSVLPGLKKLVLHYLPELVSLGDGVCLSEEKLTVYGCPKLILNSQPRDSVLAQDIAAESNLMSYT